MKINRRQLLSAVGLTAAAGGLLSLGAEVNSDDIRLERRDVHLPQLPSSFEGYRIGFLTDPHLGVFVPTEWVERGVELLLAAQIDILLLGGDFIWLPDRDLIESLYPIRNPEFLRPSNKHTAKLIFETFARVASRLRPKDGSFAVLGNHDHWTDPAACIRAFREQGIQTLSNEAVLIQRGEHSIRLVGVDDYWTAIPAVPLLPPRSEGKNLNILMTHNPDFTSELLRQGSADFDLSLSGHTHGGQIKLPLIGSPHYNINDLRFREGFYVDSGLISYTSRGLGVVELPYRINCPAEVTVLTLLKG